MRSGGLPSRCFLDLPALLHSLLRRASLDLVISSGYTVTMPLRIRGDYTYFHSYWKLLGI